VDEDKENDDRPQPWEYLRAGIPYPAAEKYVSNSSIAGSIEDAIDFLLKLPANGRERGNHSFTVVNAERQPVAVILAASTFLTGPRTEETYRTPVTSVQRLPNGFLELHTAPEGAPEFARQPPGSFDPLGARSVTIDHSVVREGFDKVKFAAEDAIFVSVALELETAVAITRYPRGQREIVAVSFRPWKSSPTVAIDAEVLEIYRKLVTNAEIVFQERAVLDRADLLCAATAILYNSPMYTTRPEAYKSLKNGLKILVYGPVRNRAAQKEREREESDSFRLDRADELPQTDLP
jgi:predicted nucleic acid-binding protein